MTNPTPTPTAKPSMHTLLNTLPQAGTVTWLGTRPERRAPLEAHPTVTITDKGIEGDHFSGRPGSKRQVTLIQHEHLLAVASMLGMAEVPPELVRRNIVVKSINLLALKNKQFIVGGAVLAMTGLCHPCSRMEENLGPGGYNAMRGHGGITARVVAPGAVTVDSVVRVNADA